MIKNKKTKVAALVAILSLVLISLYFNVFDTFDSKNQNIDKVSVRMKWFFSGTMSGWFAGVENGFFHEQGIDLTINSGGPDNNSIKLVAAGTDDFGVAGADEVIIAQKKGIPVIAIGVLFKDSPIGFIAKKEKRILSPKDWNNKRIEVDYGSNAEIQFRALLKIFNINRFEEIPYSYSLVPFIEDKVDVSVAYIMDQVITLRKKGVDLDILTSKQYGINPYGDVVITNENTIKNNPELVRRFILAFINSHKFAINNKEKAVQALIKKASSLKFENELDIWIATIPFIIPDNRLDLIGKMDYNRWVQTKDILVEFNIIESNFNLEKVFIDF